MQLKPINQQVVAVGALLAHWLETAPAASWGIVVALGVAAIIILPTVLPAAF